MSRSKSQSGKTFHLPVVKRTDQNHVADVPSGIKSLYFQKGKGWGKRTMKQAEMQDATLRSAKRHTEKVNKRARHATKKIPGLKYSIILHIFYTGTITTQHTLYFYIIFWCC